MAYVLSPINTGLCCPFAADNGDEAVMYVLHSMASEWAPAAALAQLQNPLFNSSFLLFKND
jgi:hypothetical protein